MGFFFSLLMIIDVFIDFELFSQVSDVAHEPLPESALEKPNPRLFLQPLFDLGKFPFSYRCHLLIIFSLSSSTVLKWPEETALTFSEIPAQTRFWECFVTIVQCLLKSFLCWIRPHRKYLKFHFREVWIFLLRLIFLKHQPYSMTWNLQVNGNHIP